MMIKMIKTIIQMMIPTVNFKILVLFLLSFTLSANNYNNNNRSSEILKNSSVNTEYANNKNKLVNEVNKYIKKIAPNSKLNGNIIVNIALKHDIDILLMLSQGQLESHFGTKGLGKKNNNVYNITNGSSYIKYLDVNESVEPYAITLKNRYLKNKSTKDLLKDFSCSKGFRYASSETYENDVKSIIIRIDKSTDIKKYYNNLKQL